MKFELTNKVWGFYDLKILQLLNLLYTLNIKLDLKHYFQFSMKLE